MINQALQKVLIPKNDGDWFVLITDEGAYNLRLGGFEKIRIQQIKFEYFDELELPFSGHPCINRIVSDEEEVYYLLDNEFVINSGWSDLVDLNVERDLVISICRKQDYSPGFFSSMDAKHLSLGDGDFSTDSFG